jgi:hypothetical protein
LHPLDLNRTSFLSGRTQPVVVVRVDDTRVPDATLPFPFSGDAGRGNLRGRHFFSNPPTPRHPIPPPDRLAASPARVPPLSFTGFFLTFSVSRYMFLLFDRTHVCWLKFNARRLLFWCIEIAEPPHTANAAVIR